MPSVGALKDAGAPTDKVWSEVLDRVKGKGR